MLLVAVMVMMVVVWKMVVVVVAETVHRGPWQRSRSQHANEFHAQIHSVPMTKQKDDCDPPKP